jgi:hypothetical protein
MVNVIQKQISLNSPILNMENKIWLIV